MTCTAWRIAVASCYVAAHKDRLSTVLLHVSQSCGICGASWFENLCSLPHCTVSRKVSTILNLLQLEET